MTNTRNDLIELLQEQIGFLKRSCSAFDEGFMDEAKRIAVTVRVLLHNTANSNSLFNQLKFNDYMLIDTCPTLVGSIPGRIFQAGLAVPSLKGYVPRHQLPAKAPPTWLGFEQWWNKPVIKTEDRTYSRREIVLLLANKEGGAHVDPKLTFHYEKLKHQGSGIIISRDGEDPKPMTKEEHVCLRQIAYELLESLSAIQSNEAPVDDHDNRALAFKFPVYIFVRAEGTTPINEIKVATIEVLDNLLPVFDNIKDAEKAEKMLRGDYGKKELGKNGFVSFLKHVILPQNIEFLTMNPDLVNEGKRMIYRIAVTHAIECLENDYKDEEIEQMLKEGKAKRL